MTTALQKLLSHYRENYQSEREKGTYFEELVVSYLRNEPTYKDLYKQVWTYANWAKEQNIDAKDTGIDLVALTNGTNEYHAIQCKFYDEDYRIQKKDIDSFFTASGKTIFKHRVIVTTTNNWSENAEDALIGQNPPVTKIDLHALEDSIIDWSKFKGVDSFTLKEKKSLRPHQTNALKSVKNSLLIADRGKLIMACGTGKTFTSLKIAEELAGKEKRVLFLVPSLSLLSQTLTEWTQESETPLHSFAVCSDTDIGKKRKKEDDAVRTFTHELKYPATTNSKALAYEISQRHDNDHMSVVFSTYHSIQVISEAQKHNGLDDFDLIICDEAHRTTGATFEGDEESNFVKVHDNNFIKAKKRLYMTATPRIYGEMAKATAEKENAELCSMDDEAIYGKELFVITFSEAVSRGLLVDYKVIVLTIDENHINSRLQKLLADENNQLKVDDAAKIVGCWKALSKQDQDKEMVDSKPMKRAVAFCQVIEAQKGAKVHKVSSKNIANMFQAVVEAYQEQEKEHNTLKCEAAHVDGSMNATEKEAKLNWLKDETPEDVCRILSNVRCLSEGVDVPALDAVLFLTPRNSQVDVVQSVGRIMRTVKDPVTGENLKKLGYIVLPVVIPSGVEPHDALNDNKTYRVVWEVLQALRSHDDRFDGFINKLDLIGKDNKKMEVIAITDKISKKGSKAAKKETGKGNYTIGENNSPVQAPVQETLKFEVGEIERALYAKVVKKCGNRNHWEDWAKDIAKIAQTHISRIKAILEKPENTKEIKAFNEFVDELRDDLNESITNEEVVEMLAQHLITKPVFDALFEDYSFASKNPVSQAMQDVLNVLNEHRLDKEADTLEKFYDSVKMRASSINDANAKQKIVVELYDKFFRNAFPKMTEKLGIVYTPVEVVDFIIHSVNDVLQQEFGQTLGSKGVHILDPFTGTGTFITRLMQSGLIKPEELAHKYKHEIHANEIVLLAYYIAAINIEATYHSIVGGEYTPFEGICLTDTFQLYEKDDMISALMANNSDRRKRQKELDIRVIMGNPPYSAKQKTGNDNNQNIDYPALDESIGNTYKKHSKATNNNALYDNYIRAIRWGSDRIGDSGVMAYISGSAWVERPFADGMRKCLAEEFSNLYIFNLRGDIRRNMMSKGNAKEGENIFEAGSMNGISIALFIKNKESKTSGNIFYYDIGDDLSTVKKKEILKSLSSINGITDWSKVTPNRHHDWLLHRDESFNQFIEIGDKRTKKSQSLFKVYSNGVKTNRDAWIYNYSKITLVNNTKGMVEFYNQEVARYKTLCQDLSNENYPNVEGFISLDPCRISWSRAFRNDLRKHRNKKFSEDEITIGLYRPFIKQNIYFDRSLINDIAQMPKIFPNANCKNKVIIISGASNQSGVFSAFISNKIPDLNIIQASQCFPLKLYEKVESNSDDLFSGKNAEAQYTQKDGISDEGLKHFQNAYPSEKITKEDVFYYIYGLLHSPEYRTRYADNLSKQLPRIPCVKKPEDFWAFSKAGRDLADLHINYESVELYAVKIDKAAKKVKDEEYYYVTKMKFAKKGDKSTVIYNPNITISNIPVEAYDYVVNGKPALEWVMERQCVKTDKDSGIVNDANDYAVETVGDAAYPLKLFLSVITVSMRTNKIVSSLPKLDI